MTVHSLRLRALLVGPERLVLGAVFFVAARLAGAHGTSALLAFVTGAFAIVFLALNDPRSRFGRQLQATSAPLPADAVLAPAWRHALAAAFPSTVGVSVLAAIAVAFEPALTSLLAGILAGLGVLALVSAFSLDPGLYVDPRAQAVFRK
jgi:hypothetical protein